MNWAWGSIGWGVGAIALTWIAWGGLRTPAWLPSSRWTRSVLYLCGLAAGVTAAGIPYPVTADTTALGLPYPAAFFVRAGNGTVRDYVGAMTLPFTLLNGGVGCGLFLRLAGVVGASVRRGRLNASR